jgi:DNA-binding CsgD family transcriptional regulator
VQVELRRLIQGAAAVAGGSNALATRPSKPDAGDGQVPAADAGGLVQLPRPWPQRPLTVMVTPRGAPAPFVVGTLDLDLGRPTTLLLINDPERAMQLPTEHLARTFGLIGAEAKVAALATGTSLADYAGAARITIGTARWYLKQALAKTGAHRQSELVRHVLSAMGAGAGA